MIRGGFLSEEDRKALIALARDGLAAGRVTRRATALVRLDEGLSCQEVAKVLLFDDGTIRISHRIQEMPDWVVDYVLLHELTHLVVPSHNARFWELVSRYPKAERARGYLEGISAATGLVLADD